MPATFDEFFDSLATSGIMSREEAERAIAEIPAAQKPADAKALATLWARTGKLTRYQALCLLQGKPKYLAFGEYLILDKLGQGGMGQVLKAEHRRMKRVVALKLITGDSLRNPDSVRRFQREVQAAARLIHPNIVTAFDANEHAGMHYFVMEYVDGTDLGALVKTHGPLPLDRAIDFLAQAARGLAYAHSKGIIHRDIKPSNLLLDQDGIVKILDLGLARIEREEAHELTNAGQVLGTVDYIAPEQAVNTHAADARSDIYSLGCTLYRLITGESIYTGDSLLQKLLAHRDAPIPTLRSKRADVPPALEAVFQQMVAKNPAQRQQSMNEVASQLAAIELSPLETPFFPKSIAVTDDKLSEFLSGIAERDSSGSLAARPGSSSSGAIITADRTKVVAQPATAKQTAAAASSVQSSTAQLNTAQLNTAQANTDQVNTAEFDTLISQTTAMMRSQPALAARSQPAKRAAVSPLFMICGAGGLLIGILGTAIALFRGDPSAASANKAAPASKAPAASAAKKLPDKAAVAAATAARRKAKSLDRRAAEWTIELGGTVGEKDSEATLDSLPALPATDFKIARLAIVNKPDVVTDDDLPLIWGLGELVDLNLGGSGQKIGEARLVATIAALPKLRSLNISRSALSDEGLAKLPVYAKGLRNLNVRRTKVTEGGVTAFQAALPQCRVQWDGIPGPTKAKKPKKQE